MVELGRVALVVVDVQAGFDDPWWGPRNNPDCDARIEALVGAFSDRGLPVVLVRHDSRLEDSPLHPDRPGNRLKPYLDERAAALVVSKSVNSAFHGEPDLDAWLRGESLTGIVVAGITTNHCCETTARVGGNLGYDVWFALDATHTFDRTGPDGSVLTADELDEYRASRHPARLLAKRFAVKEAALKALGTGVQQGLTLAQVGLGHDALGCPHLILSGAAAARLQALGASATHVSISDEREYALAVVIVEGDAGPPGRAPA